ncbi:hypothetical protein C2845_PM11G07370 [Panicum miliaceum]|uniref:Uncharacterized protein n=1 Tax=Panicum miliaceum TaxID=4540 RepID=A0A3L6RWA7_PANMI|nr:hypothetical protein C2845_PM11G07370 [Panicum miliaceum]
MRAPSFLASLSPSTFSHPPGTSPFSLEEQADRRQTGRAAEMGGANGKGEQAGLAGGASGWAADQAATASRTGSVEPG